MYCTNVNAFLTTRNYKGLKAVKMLQEFQYTIFSLNRAGGLRTIRYQWDTTGK